MRAGADPSSDGAAGCGGQAGLQDRGVGAAAVADAGDPRGQALGGEPVGPVLTVESGQEHQADRGVEIGEQVDRAGEDVAQVRPQLVGEGDAVGDEVFAGPADAAQRDGGRGSTAPVGRGRCAGCRRGL